MGLSYKERGMTPFYLKFKNKPFPVKKCLALCLRTPCKNIGEGLILGGENDSKRFEGQKV